MSKANVICHMYISMDGKIVTDLEGYPNNIDCEKAGDYYDEEIFRMSNAYGCGRTTYATNYKVDLAKYINTNVEIKDNIVLADKYCIVFDRKGRMFYEQNYMEYAGNKSQIIEVVTKQVTKEYLAYLQDMNIGVIIAGEDDLDINIFLEKLYKDYHVSTFVLCGGAEINAAFMASDYIDEVSLVMIPGVQGGRSELTFVGTNDNSRFPKYFKLKSISTPYDNVVHLKYTK